MSDRETTTTTTRGAPSPGERRPEAGPQVLPRPSGPGARPRGGLDTRTSTGTGVLLEMTSTDPATGVRHRRLVVEDASDDSPTRDATRAEMDRWDAALLEHPDWDAPEVREGGLAVRNDASAWFYASPALAEWRSALVPTARALYPMQRPREVRLPSGGVVDDAARRIFTDCLDAVGIRTRARIMTDIIDRRVVHPPEGDLLAARPGVDERSRWVSLACGAAVPVLDAVRRAPRGAVHLSLVDMDPGALAFADELARAQGLDDDDFTLMRRNLVSGLIARTELLDELGEGRARVVDALGIFEYFRDASCVKLLRHAHRLVAPGGALVVANMLSDRPQLAFNQRGAGWPHIYPRSVDELVRLVELAGLPLERTTVHVPQDGVYAVVEIDVPSTAELDDEKVIRLPD